MHHVQSVGYIYTAANDCPICLKAFSEGALTTSSGNIFHEFIILLLWFGLHSPDMSCWWKTAIKDVAFVTCVIWYKIALTSNQTITFTIIVFMLFDEYVIPALQPTEVLIFLL